MDTGEQLNFLTEIESVIIPRHVYLDYKRLQAKERIANPIKLGEVDNETFLMRTRLLKAEGFTEYRKGWGKIDSLDIIFTNKFLHNATFDEFIEKLDKETV